MSDNDKQEALLMAIEFLKIQYESLQNPCIALHISRYYRLLANLNIARKNRTGTQNNQLHGLLAI